MNNEYCLFAAKQYLKLIWANKDLCLSISNKQDTPLDYSITGKGKTQQAKILLNIRYASPKSKIYI